jgi:polysaccharide deacetylase family protein (PEP-CTERM system associated)
MCAVQAKVRPCEVAHAHSDNLLDPGIENLVEHYRGRNLPNAMTVDVEEYFQVSAFDSIVSRQSWPEMPSRLEHTINKVLGLFDTHSVKGTFFVLGWIAEQHPAVIRRIADEGHEIASHGHEHSRVSRLGRQAFRVDVEETRKKLEDTIGTAVIGYRAPSFSIGVDTPWAHDELAEAGYRYSSSVFPIQHDHYGHPSAPRFPYRPSSSGITEVPMSTIRLFGRNWPCSGGGYFRLLPLSYSKWAITRINSRENMPAVFYFHPWEMDPDQPRVDGIASKARFRHYLNLDKFQSRLTVMLRSFRWDRMDQVFLGAE